MSPYISLRLASFGLPPPTHDGTSQHKGEYTKELTILLWHWEEGEGRSYINVGGREHNM